MANNGSRKRDEGARSQIRADQLELIARLDGEIEALRRQAPPGHEETIAELEETMRAIHDAIGRLPGMKRR